MVFLVSPGMYLIYLLGIFCAVVAFGNGAGFGGALLAFFAPSFIGGALSGHFARRRQRKAEARIVGALQKGQQGTSVKSFDMNQALDVMKKMFHLILIGAADKQMLVTVEERLGKCHIKNPRKVDTKAGDYEPKYREPHPQYTLEAMRTVFGSGLLNDGEMRAIEFSIKPILEKIGSDGSSGQLVAKAN